MFEEIMPKDVLEIKPSELVETDGLISRELICEVCGKIVLRPKSKFCSNSCYDKFLYKNNQKFRERIIRQSAERYGRVKDTTDYKIKQKVRMDRYYSKEENKVKRSLKIKELQNKRRLDGKCWRCGNELHEGFKTCSACRLKQSTKSKQDYWKNKNHKAG